jgi:hypothetical protein
MSARQSELNKGLSLSGWGKKLIGGIEYDLGHLDDSVITVTPKAAGTPAYRVLVSYGCHCFARENKAGDPATHHVPDGKKIRTFCPIRTSHSAHLPAIIAGAQSGVAFFSQKTNMLLVEQLPGVNGPYAVFFNVQQSKQASLDAVLFVASAYEKPNLVRAMPAISFTTLIANTSKGLAVVPPTRLTSW